MKNFNIHTCVIVENEIISANHLKQMIDMHFPAISLLAICKNVAEGIDAIVNHKPDLVLMDVHLDDNKTCFDILDQLPPDDYKIIFITKSDKHAERAFEYNAVEYIQKPYKLEDIQKAIRKAGRMQFLISQKLNDARLALTNPDEGSHKCGIKNGKKLELISFDDILYFEGGGQGSDDSFVHVVSDPPVGIPQRKSVSIGKLKLYHQIPDFFLKTKSLYINKHKIRFLIRETVSIEFVNGRILKIPLSAFKLLWEEFGL